MGGVFLILGVIIFGLILFVPNKLGVLIKGAWSRSIKNIAETPEGAEMIYEKVIDDATKRYSQANDGLQQTTGQLRILESDLLEAEHELSECIKKAQYYINKNDEETAKLYATKKVGLETKIESFKNSIAELRPIVEEYKHISNQCEIELAALKEEQITIVDGIRRNQMTKEMYDRMDSLKNNNPTAQMLDAVRSGSKKKKTSAVGAKEVHNNLISTKIQKAEDEIKSSSVDNFLAELKAKNNKN